MADISRRTAGFLIGSSLLATLGVGAALSTRTPAEDITNLPEVTLERGKLYSIQGRCFRFCGMKPRRDAKSQIVFYIPELGETPYEVGEAIRLFGNLYEAPGERNNSKLFLRKKK